MRLERLLMATLLAAGLGAPACGSDGTGPSGATADPSGTGGAAGLGSCATKADAPQFIGSCGHATFCTDWWLASGQVDTTGWSDSCSDMGGTWQTSECSKTNVVGVCAAGDYTSTPTYASNVFYAGSLWTVQSVKDNCNLECNFYSPN